MWALLAATKPACFEMERFPCSFADGLDVLTATGAAEQYRAGSSFK